MSISGLIHTLINVVGSTVDISIITPELMFGAGGILLNLLVLPTLRDATASVPRTQSVLSAVVLAVCFSIPYYSIGFYIPAAANLVGSVLWAFVAIYRGPQSNTTTNQDSSSPNSNNSAQPAD